MNFTYDYSFKLVLIGDAYSGKTTIVNRLCDNQVDKHYAATIGVEFNSTSVKYKDYIVKLQFWDTAGDKCYAPVLKSYYKNIIGLYLVIDLTSNKCLRTIDYWFNEINDNKSEEETYKIIVIGNKADSSNRIISKKQVLNKIQHKNIDYVEVSALNDVDTVKDINYKMIDEIFKNFDVDDHRGVVSIKKNLIQLKNIKNMQNYDRSCCCIC